MIEIRSVAQLNLDDLRRLVTGYASDAKYAVSKTESDRRLVLALEQIPLPKPYHKRYDHLDAATSKRYQHVASLGFSFCAWDGETCVGIALAEPLPWNKSLWVHELQTAGTHRRRGVGRQLVGALAEKARAAGLRTLVCETQNTNAPAILFYHQAGFHIEGIDLSYYTNDDFPDGEIAVFMKKRLVP